MAEKTYRVTAIVTFTVNPDTDNYVLDDDENMEEWFEDTARQEAEDDLRSALSQDGIEWDIETVEEA